MATWTNVKSRANGNTLEFYSGISGDNLLVLDAGADEVQIPSGASFVSTGPRVFTQTVADLDAQSGTLTAAQIRGGILVHTSVTAAGTLTVDTGANIAAAIPEVNVAGRALDCLVVNDGTQVVTLTSAAGATFADTGQTIGADEAAILRFLCTAPATFTIYTIGA